MKKVYFLLIAMLISLGMNAQSERNINVATAGTLENFISASDKYTITKLTITGYLNGKDMVLLRDMAGAKDLSTATAGKLSELDLSGAHIVASDDVYFSYGEAFKTKDNVLGDFMFIYCKQLTKLLLPASIKEIGMMALSGTSLHEIEIPASVTTIGDGAFIECNDIKKIVVPNSVTTLGTGTFQRMEGLEEIVFGNGITDIDVSSFMNDTHLKTITFGSGVINLDITLFNGLLALEDVNVAEHNSAFASIDGVLTSSDKSELLFYPSNKPGNTYTIPDEVETIRSNAFSGTNNLTTVNISATVANIEPGAFGSAMALSSFVVDNNNLNYVAIGNILYSKNLSTLVCVPTALDIESYTTPVEVENIDNLAAAGNTYIHEITLTDNVKTVGENAFAFCTRLEKLVLGKNILSIGEGACAGDESLTAVYCYADELSDEQVNVFAFADENIMEKCTLYVPKGKLDFYNSQMWVHYVEDGEDIKFFADVKEMSDEVTSISTVSKDEGRMVSVYSADGRQIHIRRKGLNIEKMSDGSVKKIMVR